MLNKTGNILITGGTSDIGEALINIIKKEAPYKLIVTANKGALKKRSKKDKIIRVDLSNKDGIASLCKKLSQEEITHYIQLQGYSPVGDVFEKQSFDSLDINMNVNLISTIMILKTIIPYMKSSNYGRIVLMNTASSEHGGGIDSFGYGLSKHGVSFVVKHIAKYYSSNNVLANCVSPGLIDTKFHRNTLKRTDEEIEKRVKSVRLGRGGKPEDVAKLIYELSFNNEFITGENIKIDGGDYV